ncbi:hypothetical protein LMG19083_01025 [Ralstonia psammae]|uniref:Uncharacterized protein n=1 Tax=Ralstonia psammae TaxID=3058598 RepID=A0ABM9J5I4_9RALS|nr:hypothetical protein [Ralstonia sp. LMG 19083]CAJ0783310.1 hypothetical protein LMG19083_01025 [Ralstonia sp. LMG 19083]
MKRLHWLFVCALWSGASTSAHALTPTAVLSHVAEVGAKRAVLDYYETPQRDYVFRGIASGDRDWLQVYTALRQAADAGAGEDLGDAIYEAVPKRPFNVLPLLAESTGRTPRQLCTFTFESKLPEGGIGAYLDRLDRALAQASTGERRKMAAACREGIKATRRQFEGQ